MQTSLARLALCVILGCYWLDARQPLQATDFAHDVVPVLKRNCVHCHAGREAEGGFSLNTRESVLNSGAVDLNDLAQSHLLALITAASPDERMPPTDRPAMSQEDLRVLVDWIEAGVPWEAGFSFAVESYAPPLQLRAVELPPVRDGRSHPIDRIVDQYLTDNSLPRPQPIDDAAFIRRVSLDLVGLLPTEEQLNAFLRDSHPLKREQLIDALLNDEIGFADHWMTFFNDLLRNDYSGTGFITGGRKQVSNWLYTALLQNKPFDQLARELIAPPTEESQGYIDGIKWRGEVSAGQTLPIQFSQSVSQSFLGINMKCASCHDSFIDRWTLKDAYGLAAIYAEEPLELHRCDKPTGEMAAASWLFPELGQVDPAAARPQRLQQLAELMTDRSNGRFPRTIVNRLWYQLMGRGIVHPLDAMQRAPWNEDLLEFLAVDFVENGFHLKATLRRIATSSAYQSTAEVASERNVQSGDYVYRGPRSKRMTAEQFLDAVWQLTGNAPQQFDAPIQRGMPSSASATDPDGTSKLTGEWIWGPNDQGVAPGQERVVLRKQFTLPRSVAFAGVVITCDNAFELFVNERRVLSGNDWTQPQSVVVTRWLQEGINSLHVIAKNDASQPNAAGLYVQAHIMTENDSLLNIPTDDSWEYNSNAPASGMERLEQIDGQWHQAFVVPELAAWKNVLQTKALPLVARLEAGQGMPMIRAALLKNTALMKSLGRPMREQIVSMRPDTLTTLEAIDLANDPQLAEAFEVGAEQLIERYGSDVDQLIQWLFAAALARPAQPREYQILRNALGAHPDTMTVQDAMWAVCMLPEFTLIR